MGEIVKKRRGRPPKYAGEGVRQSFSFRIRNSVRDKLIAAAAVSGRSLSEEIEHLIEQSFDREGIVRDLAKVLEGRFVTWAPQPVAVPHPIFKPNAIVVPPSTASLAADQIAAMLVHWND